MDTKGLNKLFFEIFWNKDILSFDKIYEYGESLILRYSKIMYSSIKDKRLNSIDDLINQSWLNFWLYVNENRVVLDKKEDFILLCFSIVNDTIIEINR